MNFEPVLRLEKDMLKAVRELRDLDGTGGGHGSYAEMRYLVDAYYTMQEYRKATANQIRAMDTSDEPHAIIDWYLKQTHTMEKQVARALESYAGVTAPGRWMMLQAGIGPVLAANFLAHLDITKTATAGGFWRFSGLDSTVKWEKGKKRPWNAKLKTACWKASDSWVKLGNREDAFYAKIYRERKALEVERNERLKFSDQAEAALAAKSFGKNTDAYKAYSQGKLPPAHLDNRARRYAVKLFLAHLHHVMYEDYYGTEPPKPYVIAHGDHVHIIKPPLWPLEPEA